MNRLNETSVMSALMGTFTINSAVTVEKNFIGFRVDADAVIVLDDAHDTGVTSEYISDASEPIKAGTIVTINALKGENLFTKIQVVSGQVTLILS